MSLLNDALRKKRIEQQPSQPHEAAVLLTTCRMRRIPKSYYAAGVCTVAAFLLATGWWGWSRWAVPASAVWPVVATADQGGTTAAPQALPSPAVAVESSIDPTPGPTPGPTPVPMPEPTPEPTPTAVNPPAAALPFYPAMPATAQPAQTKPRVESAPMARPEAMPARRMSGEPFYRKARLYQSQGRTSEALAMYREVLKIDPNHFDTRLNLTSIYLQTGEFAQACVLAEDLYRQAPANPQVLLNLAIARIGRGLAAQALPLLDQAAALPHAPLYTIYFHKGVALRQLGQIEAAIAWYRQAEALNPADARLLFNLALALDQHQAYDQAAAYYGKYLGTAGEQIDAASRAQIQARIRALRAELAASGNGAHAQ